MKSPVIANELRTIRVPVQVSPTDVQYVTDLQWVDTPDRLFQNLIEETIRRTTNRVVLNPNQTGVDPGYRPSRRAPAVRLRCADRPGRCHAMTARCRPRREPVQTRRFVAIAPADGTAASVGPALNRAANQVAQQVAQWIGG